MIKEFKEFAVKGSVVDMAVGIMVGAAFTSVVTSVVQDLLMPPISLVTGGMDFSQKFIVLKAGATVPPPYSSLLQARGAGATLLTYGQFINTLVSFLMVALVLFFLVRWVNRLRSPDTPAAPNTRACPYCKTVIDLGATRCPNCTSNLAQDEPALS